MKRAIDIGPVEAAAIKTGRGKVRLRLLFTQEQIAALLEEARREDDGDAEPEEKVDRQTAAKVAKQSVGAGPAERVFVIEGTKAWAAWMTYRRNVEGKPSCPTTSHIVEGRSRDGWWFPSLFPPAT